MRKYLLQLMGLALVSVILYSCKLDKPILPGDPDYVAVTPPGGGTDGGPTTIIDNASLTGKWDVKGNLSVIIYTDGVPNVSDAGIKLFTDVDIDDVAKTALFDGGFNFDGNTTYTLSTTNSKTYFQFSEDPFSRSSNGPIQLVSVTPTSMTWIALDPLVLTSQGHKIQSAYEVTFTKE
jgi:hypothetical protein